MKEEKFDFEAFSRKAGELLRQGKPFTGKDGVSGVRHQYLSNFARLSFLARPSPSGADTSVVRGEATNWNWVSCFKFSRRSGARLIGEDSHSKQSELS